MPNRNSNDNDGDHHLYGIWDKKEDDLFKYGISDDPIEEDGLSDRVREQVYSLVGSDMWAGSSCRGFAVEN